MSHLSSLPLGLYEKALAHDLCWEEKLELVRNCGYDFLEISIDATPERLTRLYDAHHPEDLRKAIERVGVPAYTMALTANRDYPLGSEDDAIRGKGMEIVERGIAFASRTGIRIVHLAAYDELGSRCNQRTRERFQQSIGRCAETAAEKGIILALETMDAAYMESCANIMKLCRAIDSPYLQCYADIGNLTASGVDVDTDLRHGGRHIVGVHLKDTRPGVYRDVLYGEGTVNFDLCLRTLRAIGYSGFFAAEMWSHDDVAFHGYLPRANRYLREKLSNY
ncbi:MAG: L-ribulose-5-phosphate 3-epimerase [Clostridiales bacterium]|nr:L-ribulose-5-phosphate 3-epimerase [Clostridiales bacterium]